MIFLLDSNAFSDLMRKHPKIADRLTALADTDKIAICTIVRGEILYGLERLPQGRRRENLRSLAAPLFAALSCEPVPEPAGDHYARIKRSREQDGLALDENDLWIAATAVALGAVLVSRDGDFARIDGLNTQDWMSDAQFTRWAGWRSRSSAARALRRAVPAREALHQRD